MRTSASSPFLQLFSQTLTIAAAECRRLLRDRSGLIALAIVLLFVCVAALTTYQRSMDLQAQRDAHAAIADAQWHGQPDRHPHRVVHYGDFVFKPASVLAAIEWGVESHTGRSLFLEGHRQNTANFSEAGQAGPLLRFGQLTPAMMVLQLLPLVLIFVGAASLAGERQSGVLQTLIVSGASGRAVVAGRFVALMALAMIALLPLAVVVFWIGIVEPQHFLRGALLFLVHAGYLAIWCAIVVAVSALSRSAYAALLAALCLWVAWCVVVPRAAPSVAALLSPAPSRATSEMRAEQALNAIGDSHNPDDPYFASFRARTLARYGVGRVGDLPVNYGGLLMIEGERLTSAVHAREVARLHARHAAQNRFVDGLGWIVPSLAAGIASRSLAGTDADHHRHFVDASERRRYAMVQALNTLHAEKIRFRNDREQRLDAGHWHGIPRDDYALPGLRAATSRLQPALAALGLWLVALSGLLAWCGKRLERGT
jgi:ABC-2 type transport system permease protein